MAPAYEPPAWSALPEAGSYSLEIIREGVVLESIDISKRSFYILGRDPASAQVVLPHPSVSRQHAAIQHRDSGGVWLMDLGSTHGTILNKKPCPPNVYVRLPVGATVRLGTGSRLVCLLGPPDAEEPGRGEQASTARQAARAQRLAATTGKSAVSAEDLHGGGAGWGFTADAAADAREEKDEEELDRHGLEALLAMVRKSELRLSARQQRLLEQIEKRTEKLAHIAQESSRITAKEADGLSAGQEAALKRNEERAGQLTEQVESLRDQLAEAIREQLGAVRKVIDRPKKRTGGREGSGSGGDDDDAFFDRTDRRGKRKAEAVGGGSEEVLSEATLCLKLDALDAEAESLGRRLRAVEQEQAAIPGGGDTDALDAYMRSNAAVVADRRVRELREASAANAAERQKVKALLAFVRPAMRAQPLRVTEQSEGHVGAGCTAAAGGAAGTRGAKPGGCGSGLGAALAAMRKQAGEETGAAGGAAANAGADGARPMNRPGEEPAEQRNVGPSMPDAARRATSDTFRSEFAAAVERMRRGDEAAEPDGAGRDTGGGAGRGRDTGGGAAEEAPAFVGLGFGASRPDEAAVRSARESVLEEKRRRLLEASMAAGLNTMEGGVAASGGVAGPPPPRRTIGPARPPPSVAAGRAAGGEEGDAAEWVPPLGQDGSGRTALNAKLGY